ncbi:MAG TPA: biosynthetic peptidoglycan transglycosylase [Draconibacterium sp.]|nr:biosynthetic peptidoglycan transglycosylase [Draconibacterium sp.]
MEFQQYYPTYNYKERDVVLAEFEEAQKIANTQSKLYGQLANFLIAFVTVGITLLLKTSDKSTNQAIVIVKENVIFFDIFLGIIGLVILRYFIELQRTIVINSRKVITLRRMLGLDYGLLQLTIPNWRVEGATNPFAVRLFPGWLKFGSSPFWIIALTLNVFWYFSLPSINYDLITQYWYVINILITFFYALVFRIQLNETHESFYLLTVKNISKLLRIKLIKDFEYVLYRSKLSVNEKDRLKYKTRNVEQILIEIEDSRFYKHKGIDFKSIARSVLSLSKRYRKRKGLLKSGGSTITMQLCRTLLIPSNQNPIRRKVIEMLLSIWYERQFSKIDILAFYLTSVRFEKRINGIISATKYFFPDKEEKTYSNEEAFFLIERLSNISSTYRKARIRNLFDRIPSSIEINWELLLKIYEKQERNHAIQQM